MNLFKDTYLFEEDGEERRSTETALYSPWQSVDIVSSNCPIHIGVRLAKIGDNQFQCPKGREMYKAKGSVANQNNKDRYDLGFDIIKSSSVKRNNIKTGAMKMIKISIRDSGENSDAVDPLDFDSEYLLGPQRVNNVNTLVKNMYYMGYTSEKAIMEQLKLRGIESDTEVKKAVKECLEHLESSKEQSPKK